MAVYYDPTSDIWPDLALRRNVLAPVGVGMNRRTGRILVGFDHVIQSLEVLFATRYHERILRRWAGSFVPHVLGENITQETITRFYWAIASSIDLWEPRYSIQRVRIWTREDGSNLTSIEEIRRGEITVRIEGIYKPRGHLGDPTPENRRTMALTGRGNNVWEGRALAT